MFDKLFENIGRQAGKTYKKGKWMYDSLLGSEEEAVKAEFSMGLEMAKGMAKQYKIVEHKFVKEFSSKVREEIVTLHKFNFYVIESKEENAFALPGGFIFITNSMIEFCEEDIDTIAFILSHEMGHVIKGHSIGRVLAEFSVNSIASVIGSRSMIANAVKMYSAKYLLSAYSRENEYEADLLGAKIATRLGYKKDGAIKLFNRFEKASPSEKSYFGTHPNHKERIENILEN